MKHLKIKNRIKVVDALKYFSDFCAGLGEVFKVILEFCSIIEVAS